MKIACLRATRALPLLCGLLPVLYPSEGFAATSTVEISGFAFHPDMISVKVGDTVTWLQKDSTRHTTTSGVAGVPDGTWDSGLLSTGQSFSFTFTAAGEYSYFCRPHTFMVGSITVEEVTAALPTVSIIAPTNNAVFASGSNIVLEATAAATGATVTQVEFQADGNSLGVVNSAPYTLTVNLTPGTHTLTAKVTDSNGGTATSSASTVQVSGGGTRIDNPIPAKIAKADLVVELEPVLDGLISPLGLVVPDDGSGRMFIYDQAGLVYVLAGTNKLDTPLLDVQNRLVPLGNYDERGLLGLATHPNFAQHPLIYTYTSEPNGPMADFMTELPAGATNNHQSVLAEWRIDTANSNRVDLASRREILRVDEPQANHNAGTLRFGPDGYLYISFGDGGAADDQGDGHVAGGNGQNKNNIYGSVVRIDVDARTSANGQYGVPSDNPFVSQGLGEIYAYGFRNPFNYSFDRLTGELYLADVGQNQVEEIDRIFKGGNYGWPIKEGGFYFDPNGTNAGFVTSVPVRDVPPDLADPIAHYDHDEGSAVVGGYVYRGSRIPGLIGRYVAGDWGSFSEPSGRLFYLDQSELHELRIGVDDRPLGLWVKGFGQDASGELYVFGSTNLGPHGTSGKMLRIGPRPLQLQITAIQKSGTNVMLTWSDSVGPVAVQSQEELYDNEWQTVALTGDTSTALPIEDTTAFFRLKELSGFPAVPFTVFLSGAAERPDPVNTPASGSGTLSLVGNTLHFDIQYSGLTGPAGGAHIHGPGRASEAAPILIDLKPFNGAGFSTNGTLSGAVALTAAEKAMLLDGATYVNIHTAANGGGEIRGQIAPVVFAAHLSGEAERPDPVETAGEGSGIFFLVGNQLSFNIGYGGLSAAAVAAHIHGPATTDQPAPVLIDFKDFTAGGFGTNGTFAGTVTLTPDQLSHVVDGLTYFNIHTPGHGGGEIRGQILPQSSAVPFTAALSGAAERPTSVDTPGSGMGLFSLDGNELRLGMNYSGLSGPAVAAHLHGPATATQATNVLLSLEPFNGGAFGTNGTFQGIVQLSDEQRAMLLQGLLYANIHTPAHGGGEIRGQLNPVLRRATLLGASERPQAVQTGGQGSGHFLLIGDQLHLNVTYGGLSTNAVAAHIHGPASSAEAADVLVSLETLNGGAFRSAGALAGSLSLSPEALAALSDGLTYVNVHTSTHGGGEIRGQLVP